MSFNDYQNLKDSKLIELTQDGDYLAFEQLVKKYYKNITNLLYQYTKDENEALDLTQEVFVKIYKKLNTFNPEYRFKIWLYRIATNTAISSFRKSKVRVKTCSVDETNLNISDFKHNQNIDSLPEKRVIQKEKRLKILNIIDELNEKYRDAFILRHFYEMKYDEIVEILDIPLGTVKTYIHRARNEFIDKINL